MAINIITAPTATAPAGVTDYQAQNNYLNTYTLDVEKKLRIDGSNVLKGAIFNVGGSLYLADSDTAITGTASDYVKLTVSGTTLVPSFVASISALSVTFNDTYNMWQDASGNGYIFNEQIAFIDGEISEIETRYLKQERDGDVYIKGFLGVGVYAAAQKLNVKSDDTGSTINDGAFKFTAISGYGADKNILYHRQDADQIVINEDGVDLDFRIEGVGEANLFLVDASALEVFINGNLDIDGNIILDNGNADGANLGFASAGFNTYFMDNFSGDLRFVYSSVVRAYLYDNGSFWCRAGRKVTDHYQASSVNMATIFNHYDSILPSTTGVIYVISGAISAASGTGTNVLSAIERVSSSSIRIYYYDSSGPSVGSNLFSNAAVNTYYISASM